MAKKAAAKGVGIRPIADRVLVKPLEGDEEKSPSGIILPDSGTDDKKDRGEVVAVGEGKRGDDNKLIPVSVSIGDKVIFQWGEKVEYGGEEYYLVVENNILAVID